MTGKISLLFLMQKGVVLIFKFAGRIQFCLFTMSTLDLHYITDKHGQRSGVQLPIKDWERIKKELEELERLRNKKLFLSELAEAIEEMKQIKDGQVIARDADEFINEL